MKERRFGRIVNFTSIYAYLPPGEQIAYGAAKGGVSALTRALSVDLAPYGVTVNAVSPGVMWHDRLEAVLDENAQNAEIARTPMGRLGSPDEIPGLVAYLCSESSAYLTGQILHANGGSYLPG
jgi:NAD(P)-dependent dehydrogenase (short-subunit alcohol dehydrogenase family)